MILIYFWQKMCLAITDWRLLYRRQMLYQFLAILYTSLLFFSCGVIVFGIVYSWYQQRVIKTVSSQQAGHYQKIGSREALSKALYMTLSVANYWA